MSDTQVVRESVAVRIVLSDAQANAVAIMGATDRLAAIGRATIAARIKGDFKRYREAEAKVNAQIYDDSSRRGAKWPMSKDEFLRDASKRSAAIWSELGE